MTPGSGAIALVPWLCLFNGQSLIHRSVAQAGSLIVEALRTYRQPVTVYLPPGAELRGGAWVVVDGQINAEQVWGCVFMCTGTYFLTADQTLHDDPLCKIVWCSLQREMAAKVCSSGAQVGVSWCTSSCILYIGIANCLANDRL